MDPLNSALALVALGAFCASAWGWGRAVLELCSVEERGVAFSVALGLAALAAVGGWLNLAGIAVPPVLWALLAGGWFAAARALRGVQWRDSLRAARDPGAALCGGLIALAGLYLAATLLPGGAFNPNDDFQLYFARPLRMLQAGTLGRNPFDPLGFDSLGGYPFLQAFPLLALPPGFFYAFDAVLAPLLAAGLVVALGGALRLPALPLAATLAVLALVPPQQVNVSAVYATTAFALALVPAAVRLVESNAPWRAGLPLGLLAAALLGLKVTLAVFLVPAAMILLALMAGRLGALAALRRAGATAAWTALFLASWLLLHAGKYAGWLRGERGAADYGVAGNPASLLTDAPLLWGGSVMRYNALAVLALAAAAAGAVAFLRRREPAAHPALAPLASVCGAAAVAYLLNTLPYDLNHAVRYSAPVLVAGAACAALLAGSLLPRAAAAFGPLALAVMAGTLFAGENAARAQNAWTHRTVLAYPPSEMPKYAFMTRWGLDPEVRAWVRRAQSATRPGEPILALIACPYDLLFARNPVLVASEFGLSTPWIGLPLDADSERVRRYLLERGARYVIWQIGAGVQTDEQLAARLGRPYAVDRLLARNLASFRRSLAELTRASAILHVDDGLIVLDITQAREPAPRDSPAAR